MNSLSRERLFFFFILGFIVLVFVFLGIVFFTRQIRDTRQTGTTTSPFIADIAIKNVSPPNNAKGIGIFPPIEISFSKLLSSSEQRIIKIESSPEIQGFKKWSSDGKTVTMTVVRPLLVNQTYVITIYGLSEPFSWSFATADTEDVPIQDQLKSQAEGDRKFAAREEEVLTKYPWIHKLPIRSENYFASFDPNISKFTVMLFPSYSSSRSIEEQNEEFKQEINQRLRSLGVDDPSVYGFVYVVREKQ